MKKIITLIMLFISVVVYSQNVTVDGTFTITEVAPSDTANNVLVWVEYGRVERYTIDQLVIKYIAGLPNSTQWLLDMGESPVDMVNAGTPADSLLGRFYKGGYIIYLDTLDLYPDFEGLVAGEEDLGTALFGCFDMDIVGVEDASLGGGEQNTLDILNGCPETGIIAEIVDDWISHGYDDWYLPNLTELQLVHDILFVNGITSFGTSGLETNYAASQEHFNGTSHRWNKMIQIPNNLSFISSKVQPDNIRAVRKF